MPDDHDHKAVRLRSGGDLGRTRTSSLRRLAEIGRIMVDLDARAEVSLMLVFSVVAGEGRPLSGREVWDISGLSKTSTNRHLLTLSSGSSEASAREGGFGLIQAAPNPFDGRSRLYSLTPAGERLAHRLASVLLRDE